MRHIAGVLTLTVAACVLSPAEAIAQTGWFHLNPLIWEIELEYEGVGDQRGGTGNSWSNQYTEKIEIEQSGYSFDPNIFNFSITVTPTLSQGQFDHAVRDERIDGTYIDYEISLRALRGSTSPIDLGARASRNTQSVSSNLGNRTDVRRENRFVDLGIKVRAFPMTLSYGERLLDQTFKSAQSTEPRHRDDIQRSVRWQGRSSKLQMHVEKSWFDDRIGDNDFDILQQATHHSLRWGKNSHLRTQQNYYSREGSHAFKRISVFEGVRLQHLDNLYSTLDYSYSSVEQDDETKVQSGKYSVNYRPDRKLGVGFGVEGRNSELGTGSEKEYGGTLDLNYRRDIFSKGKLNIGLNGSLLQTERLSNGSTFESVDVFHEVPATLIVLLDARAIDASSILVTDLASSQVFLEGVDYIVRSLSGERTELQILTSGLIAAGDTILISYRAAAQPPAEFETESLRANISLDFDWVRLYHSTRVKNHNLQSGSFSEGQGDLRDQTTGLELKWSGQWFEATVKAEAHSFESGEFSTESESLIETAQFQISPFTQLYMSASQISFLSDGRETELSQWDVNLNWTSLRGVKVQPFVGGWNRQEELGPFEERLNAGVKLTWKLRQFELDLDFRHLEHVTGNTDRSEQRVGVRIVRRSR